jgi:prolipoprotein diacylglyceryltransferase
MLENSYVLFSILGYLAGSSIFVLLAVRAKRNLAESLGILAVIILASLFGAKIFHTLFEADGHGLPNGDVAEGVVDLLAADPWHWARILSPGYVFYGGLVASMLMGALYMWWRRIDRPLQYADFAAPALAIGLAFGRIGCFLGGCCFGREVGDFGPLPVQLIESLFAFACFVFLLPRRPGQDGSQICLFLVAYSSFRFFIEFLRGDPERGFWLYGWLSTSQIISLLLLAGCLWVVKPRKG